MSAIPGSSGQILGAAGAFTRTRGAAQIEGKNAWEWGGENNSDRDECEAFIKSVREGQPGFAKTRVQIFGSRALPGHPLDLGLPPEGLDPT